MASTSRNNGYNKLVDFFDIPRWLFFTLLLIFILRIPSFLEPYSYGDETIYLTLGEAIRQGIPLYSGVHDNKPPLLYIVAAISGNLFFFKTILAFWNVATIILFWKLAKTLFTKSSLAMVAATFTFAILTTLPLLEGNIANAELFMIGPAIWAFLLLLKKPGQKQIFWAGTLFSLATLFKVPAFFDIGAIVILWVMQEKLLGTKTLKKLLSNTIVLAAGFFLPIALSFLWFYAQGAYFEYLVAAFLQNVGYLSSWRPDDVQEPFLIKNLPLLTRFFVVVVGLGILYVKKARLSKEFVFACAWLLFALFGVTLSERPYPHYLIQAVPPVCLIIGILVAKRNYEQIWSIPPLALAAFVPFFYHFWHYPTLSYYQRFLNFAGGQITKEEYLRSFGGQVVSYYKTADFIKRATNPNEKIFVWGEGSQVYALSKRFPPGKYVADYHIRDFSTNEELLATLAQRPPALFLVFPQTRELPHEIVGFLTKNYAQVHEIEGVIIWKLLSTRVRQANF